MKLYTVEGVRHEGVCEGE